MNYIITWIVENLFVIIVFILLFGIFRKLSLTNFLILVKRCNVMVLLH